MLWMKAREAVLESDKGEIECGERKVLILRRSRDLVVDMARSAFYSGVVDDLTCRRIGIAEVSITECSRRTLRRGRYRIRLDFD